MVGDLAEDLLAGEFVNCEGIGEDVEGLALGL